MAELRGQSAPEQLVYWDSNCFLGILRDEADKADRCQEVMEAAADEKITICTSALTITEVLWLKGGQRLKQEQEEKVNGLFKKSYIRVVDLNRPLAECAQILVWRHRVKPKDAVHVATAIDLDVAALETFDSELLELNGMVGDGLVIRKPGAESWLRRNA